MKHCKNQLTMLITQYYCKTLSNCILENDDLISGPLTEVTHVFARLSLNDLQSIHKRNADPMPSLYFYSLCTQS